MDQASRADFRNGMARLASGIAIVATAGPGGRAGLTVTALTAVTDDPPTLLVCVNRSGGSAGVITANRAFSVSVLNAEDQPAAETFAGRTGRHGPERFAVGVWREEGGLPLLATARAVFLCTLADVHAVESHDVLFGRVRAVIEGPPGPALVYEGRRFQALGHDAGEAGFPVARAAE